MTNYYFPIIYIVPLISVDGQASPRLFIAPEIRHEKAPMFFMGNFFYHHVFLHLFLHTYWFSTILTHSGYFCLIQGGARRPPA